MEKIVTIDSKIQDLWGLYVDLRRSCFAVKNVGQDNKGTHVYLSDEEGKDPTEIIQSWVNKPPQSMSPALKKRRAKEYEEILAMEKIEQEKRREKEELAMELKVDQFSASGTIDVGNKPISFKDSDGSVIGELMEGNPSESDRTPWIKRIWKSLW